MPIDVKPMAQIKQPEQPVAAETPMKAASPVQIEQVLESIAQYNQFGKALKRATTMQEVGTQLAQIAELAEQAVVSEGGDWFDQHTVSRNMKEIKQYAKEFSKLALEADQINQRMQAYYDDMGRVLERYFEIPDLMEPDQVDAAPNAGEEGGELQDPKMPLKETGKNAPDPAIYRATPLPPPAESDRVDQLTLKAIDLVQKRLSQKNPALATKFAQLTADKKAEMVWKLVQ
jgi:hypothetical protein